MRKFRSLVAYGVGDFGLNIYWNTISFYLVYWYTIIVGLDAGLAGLLYMIGMIWDAVSDPVIASLSERMKTRYGSYRPFILFGSWTLAFFFTLLFWIPPFDGKGLIISLVAMNLLFRTAYALVAVPYAAMSSRLTYDSVERADYSGMRMFFAFAGLLAVSMFLPPLLENYTDVYGSQQIAFKWVAATGSLIATLSLLVCFAFTRELPLPKLTKKSEKIWHGIWQNVSRNKALQLLLVVSVFKSGAFALLNISLVFFIETNQASFAAKEIVMTAYAIATMIFVPFWTVLIKKIGRKPVWTIATLIITIAGLHMLAYGPFLIMEIPAQVIVFGACNGAFAILIWAFTPDCVEYGQDASGFRSEAGVFGSTLIAKKISGGVMGFIVGLMLQSIGYSANTDGKTEQAGQQLINFLAIYPGLLLSLSLIPLFFLPLGRDIHSNIMDKLSGDDT